MKLLFLLISINLAFIVIGNPDVKHFYIESNGMKCALFDLNADIDVTYSTKLGLRSTHLNMSLAQGDQHGVCDNGTFAAFNITIDPNIDAFVNFDLINSNHVVTLTAIQFGVTLSNNSYFPGAIEKGYFSESLYKNISLSKDTNFYQCNSKFIIPLSANVTLNIYFAKLKAFNVVNNSFGNEMDECQEDFNNVTTISTFSTSTSETKTTDKTVSTSTPLSTKSTMSTTVIPTSHTSTSHASTSLTSTSHASTSLTSTSHTSTSHSSTSHSSISPSTSSIFTASNPSTKSSSFYSSTHLSTIPMSTTVNPKQTFLYAVKNNKEICLLIESTIDVLITYKIPKDKTTTKLFSFSNSSFTGYCSPSTNTITITSVPDINITLVFSKKDSNSALTEIQLMYILSNQSFPGYIDPEKQINETKSFNDCKVDTSKGYKCKTLNFTLSNSIVQFNSFHYEAFRTESTLTFKPEITNCESSNSIVAIVVGIVLAVFLIIIVVVFLILRYRANKRKGYEEI